jgi:outer membrane protein assembly factor BamB
MANRQEPSIEDLVFVGFNRRVAALHRRTGELAWDWKSPKGSGFVALLVDGDELLVSIDGYTFALDAATGRELWHNPLTGLGTGVACLASARGTALLSGGAAQETANRADRSHTVPPPAYGVP